MNRATVPSAQMNGLKTNTNSTMELIAMLYAMLIADALASDGACTRKKYSGMIKYRNSSNGVGTSATPVHNACNRTSSLFRGPTCKSSLRWMKSLKPQAKDSTYLTDGLKATNKTNTLAQAGISEHGAAASRFSRSRT